ncbi:Neurotrophin 1 like protein [Argiope bruennichi]|uniref:Neurotrophin 1 like protein n=1 Tax=Argiope bruennichi TaxID=94029 RepID=A0A8T0EWW1_ARGBR|nr:Neurotrophin 1 like protein [Argiope bruennichi]
MSCAVLLLSLVLIATATSQSTTETPAASEVPNPPKEEKPSNIKFFVIKDDNATDIDDVDGEDNGDPMERAESQARFTFSQADARPWTKPPEEVDDDVEEGDSGDDDTAIKLLEELTSLVDTGVKIMDRTTNDSDTSVTKIKEIDNDSEEDGEVDDIPSDDDVQPAGSKAEESQIKRQDESNPFNQNKATSLDFDQPNRRGEIPAPPPDVYVTVNDQPDNSNPENDNSPLLQLTQGGYRSPYGFNTESPRVRAQSASQQSETVEDPAANINNDEQFRQPQISPQVSYADPFQSQFGFGSALGLRHPFIPPDSFVNSNGMVHQPVQSGFFNIPPAGFTDFTGANFQAPFSPSNDGGFQVLPRNPGGISLFQTSTEHVAHTPGYMVQNQQFPQSQFLATDPAQSTPTMYQTTGFLNYPGSENVNAAPRPDYSPFFRNPSPNNLQFQVNNNPFAPPRSAAGILYNPMMQFQSNFANRPQYSPQYPAPNQQIQVQNIAPEEKKQQDLDKITEGETTNSEEQINTPSSKEDSSSVPFGARIQRQNGQDPQSDFPPQADVFMRYPVKEAGYATEESLPVQNTTTKTETKTEPSPPRPIFSFFQAPGQFGDPYRNALNAVQQGYAADTSVRNNDDNNSTKQVLPEQLPPPRMTFPFSQPALARPIPGYPDGRGPNQPLIRPPSFFRAVNSPATDPFDQIAVFLDQYPGPPQTSGRSQEAPVLPTCAHGQTNASVCFEDPEYPKRDVLFALNSNPFLTDLLSMPDQQLDGISLVEQEHLEQPESPANYICSSKIRYGFPLRAKDVNGQWKVIVNIEKDVGQGRFTQPVRLEMCKGAGDPCNFTQVKTACVQKYNLHRLLSWSPEKGIHNDVFKLPVACSCQLIDAQA